MSGLSRREFLATSAAALAAARPGFGVEAPEQRTIAHFLNVILPGDDGQPLFAGDSYPLKSGGDTSAGAFSAGALDVFYDPYYGIAGTSSLLLARALDRAARLDSDVPFFYAATQAQQIEAVDAVAGRRASGDRLVTAAGVAMSGILGAAVNDRVTRLVGWPGANGGYFSLARHPQSRWLQPSRATADGNLP